MKVSFDFDLTLSRPDVQEFAKELVKKGVEVWIVTSRFDNESNNYQHNKPTKLNQKLFDIADNCGIKRENIKFTNMCDKIEFLEGKNFLFHLDDNNLDIELIEESDDNCKGILLSLTNWKEQCLSLMI